MSKAISDFSMIKSILERGDVIAYPTETVYGLGADPFQREAVEKVLGLKNRPLHQSPLLLMPNKEWVAKLTKNVSPLATKLMDAFWPGPLTIVFEASRDVPSWLLRDDETIALRHSSHGWVKEFLDFYGHPIISTSANPTGAPSAHTVDQVRSFFADRISFYVDGGKLEQSKSSTIVSISDDTVHLLRAGDISLDDLKQFADD